MSLEAMKLDWDGLYATISDIFTDGPRHPLFSSISMSLSRDLKVCNKQQQEQQEQEQKPAVMHVLQLWLRK